MSSDKLLTAMSIPTILDMDPLTFILTILSILGLLFSAINFLRHFTPTNLYVHNADAIAQTRSLYDLLEQEGLLSRDKGRHRQLNSCLEALEEKLKPLVFVIMPTRNIFRVLRAWVKIRKLLEISRDIELFRVAIGPLKVLLDPSVRSG
ncbi:hypothetical protein NLJ89_g10504 [Agrocybe chaxingu]|uniref:Uncharacterized protein n=1 Tax=Agrocybe chaxingu TaxID=84603 RepID=A0A9W8JU52_9AGAR|nr:hypothetical protein NLJ89_g10504 [Agrocybe chaxingu]